MTDREKQLREEIAQSVESLLEEGGTERLLAFIRGEGELKPFLATSLVRIRDWEEDTDSLLEWVMEKIPFVTSIPFVGGFVRKKMDDQLPQLVLNPILERLLVDPAAAQHGGPDREIDFYGYLKR